MEAGNICARVISIDSSEQPSRWNYKMAFAKLRQLIETSCHPYSIDDQGLFEYVLWFFFGKSKNQVSMSFVFKYQCVWFYLMTQLNKYVFFENSINDLKDTYCIWIIYESDTGGADEVAIVWPLRG